MSGLPSGTAEYVQTRATDACGVLYKHETDVMMGLHRGRLERGQQVGTVVLKPHTKETVSADPALLHE